MASLYVAPSFGDGVLASSEAISLLNIMSLFLILDSSLFDSSLTLNAVSKALIDDAATTAVVMMVGSMVSMDHQACSIEADCDCGIGLYISVCSN